MCVCVSLLGFLGAEIANPDLSLTLYLKIYTWKCLSGTTKMCCCFYVFYDREGKIVFRRKRKYDVLGGVTSPLEVLRCKNFEE